MRLVASGLAAFCAVVLLVACGDSGASQEELNEAQKQGIAKERQRQKLKEIEKELEALRKGRGEADGDAPSAPQSSGAGNCGDGLTTNEVTTCPFAENVRADYYEYIVSGSGSVYSYSPSTGQGYDMFCTGGSPHECTGGNEAYVSFP